MANDPIVGRRVYLEGDDLPVEQGDYGKAAFDGNWYCRVPAAGFGAGSLSKHEIIEHEDGTITVAPSILIYDRDGNPGWHGYLVKGVWRQV